MSRPLSLQKREAIFSAAANLFAAVGTGAPTARIAKDAGVAEGTLFTYFFSKDELLNQLYLKIKLSLAATINESYPKSACLSGRILHLWNRYIDWGAAHPAMQQAMRCLSVSERITEATKAKSNSAFSEINSMIEDGLKDGGLLKDLSPDFLTAMLETVAQTTLDFIAREPEKAAAYKTAGFQDILERHCALITYLKHLSAYSCSEGGYR